MSSTDAVSQETCAAELKPWQKEVIRLSEELNASGLPRLSLDELQRERRDWDDELPTNTPHDATLPR